MKRLLVGLVIAGAIMAQDVPLAGTPVGEKTTKVAKPKKLSAAETRKLALEATDHLEKVREWIGTAESYFDDYDRAFHVLAERTADLNTRVEALEKEKAGLKAQLAAAIALAAVNPK
jgi:hypothetical protein